VRRLFLMGVVEGAPARLRRSGACFTLSAFPAFEKRSPRPSHPAESHACIHFRLPAHRSLLTLSLLHLVSCLSQLLILYFSSS